MLKGGELSTVLLHAHPAKAQELQLSYVSIVEKSATKMDKSVSCVGAKAFRHVLLVMEKECDDEI